MIKALVILGALTMVGLAGGCNVEADETEVDPRGADVPVIERWDAYFPVWSDVSVVPNFAEYYYIVIDNTGGSTEVDAQGVDIDSAAIISPDGLICWADTIGSATYIGGGGGNEYSDEFNALGVDDCPDAGPWPQCFVSLGEDGSLSLGFEGCPGGILPGDIIEVGEIMGGQMGVESCLLSLCCDDDCLGSVPIGEGEDIFSYEVYEADLADCDRR